jgi:glycosyltransferase involved in cell wall biosynthesis
MLMAGIAPTVAVMHDLWLLTGRCAYTGGCEKLWDGCDETCPTPNEYPELAPDRIAGAWAQKRVLFRLPTFHAGSGSKWLLDQAERAGTLQKDAATSWFGYGLDTSLFVPGDRQFLRKELGLPEMAFIVIVAAVTLGERRKGLTHLVDALERLRERGLLLVCIGSRPPPDSPEYARLRRFEPVYTGYLEDERMLARYLAAADVFVGPSTEEAFGQVFIEAAACGTPSIGFGVGGVTEALRSGVTGYLAHDISGEALARALRDAIADKRQREGIGMLGRLDAESRFSLEALYARFLAFLRRNDVLPRLELPRKISFDRHRAPPATPCTINDSGVWQPIDGVLKRSASDPAIRLDGVYYWLTDHARIEVRPGLGFPCSVAMRVRNFLPGQSLRILDAGAQPVTIAVPVTDHATDHLIQFTATGQTLVIEAGMSFAEGDNRLAVLLVDVAVC